MSLWLCVCVSVYVFLDSAKAQRANVFGCRSDPPGLHGDNHCSEVSKAARAVLHNTVYTEKGVL